MAVDLTIVFVTVPNIEDATSIAKSLVEAKLAACVNIISGVQSIFRWEDKIEANQEVLLKVKSQSYLIPEIEQLVTKLHPYAVPEIVSIEAVSANSPYLKWVGKETKVEDSL